MPPHETADGGRSARPHHGDGTNAHRSEMSISNRLLQRLLGLSPRAGARWRRPGAGPRCSDKVLRRASPSPSDQLMRTSVRAINKTLSYEMVYITVRNNS